MGFAAVPNAPPPNEVVAAGAAAPPPNPVVGAVPKADVPVLVVEPKRPPPVAGRNAPYKKKYNSENEH